MDEDTKAVIDRLTDALETTGLSGRALASALGTSPSRFHAYRTGATAPSAAFLLRTERIAGALGQARRENVPTLLDAVDALARAVAGSDQDWAYAVALELSDRLRDTLRRRPDLAPAWEAQPPARPVLQPRWWALSAAFVSHEFTQAGRTPPRWTNTSPLRPEWVVDTPRLSEAQVRAQTPAWLAERGIYVAEKDLLTA